MNFVGLVVIDRCDDDYGEDDSAKFKMMFIPINRAWLNFY